MSHLPLCSVTRKVSEVAHYMGNSKSKSKKGSKNLDVEEGQEPVRTRSELHKLELKRRREEEEKKAREQAQTNSNHDDANEGTVPKRQTSHISETLAEHRPPPIQPPASTR